jgi:hypothetical protein
MDSRSSRPEVHEDTSEWLSARRCGGDGPASCRSTFRFSSPRLGAACAAVDLAASGHLAGCRCWSYTVALDRAPTTGNLPGQSFRKGSSVLAARSAASLADHHYPKMHAACFQFVCCVSPKERYLVLSLLHVYCVTCIYFFLRENGLY